MGSWKTKLRVSDLPDDARLELQCKKCSHVRYLTRSGLRQRNADELFLDMVERRAHCRVFGCGGNMRMSMMHKSQTSGFVGGLA